jgi:hypothetical protein
VAVTKVKHKMGADPSGLALSFSPALQRYPSHMRREIIVPENA